MKIVNKTVYNFTALDKYVIFVEQHENDDVDQIIGKSYEIFWDDSWSEYSFFGETGITIGHVSSDEIAIILGTADELPKVMRSFFNIKQNKA